MSSSARKLSARNLELREKLFADVDDAFDAMSAVDKKYFIRTGCGVVLSIALLFGAKALHTGVNDRVQPDFCTVAGNFDLSK